MRGNPERCPINITVRRRCAFHVYGCMSVYGCANEHKCTCTMVYTGIFGISMQIYMGVLRHTNLYSCDIYSGTHGCTWAMCSFGWVHTNIVGHAYMCVHGCTWAMCSYGGVHTVIVGHIMCVHGCVYRCTCTKGYLAIQVYLCKAVYSRLVNLQQSKIPLLGGKNIFFLLHK